MPGPRKQPQDNKARANDYFNMLMKPEPASEAQAGSRADAGAAPPPAPAVLEPEPSRRAEPGDFSDEPALMDAAPGTLPGPAAMPPPLPMRHTPAAAPAAPASTAGKPAARPGERARPERPARSTPARRPEGADRRPAGEPRPGGAGPGGPPPIPSSDPRVALVAAPPPPSQESFIRSTREVRGDFGEAMGDFLTYPLRSGGLSMVLVGGVFFGVANWIVQYSMFGWALLGLISSYLLAYQFKALKTSSLGNCEPPDWPDVEEAIGTLWQMVGCFLACWGLPLFFFFAGMTSSASDVTESLVASGMGGATGGGSPRAQMAEEYHLHPTELDAVERAGLLDQYLSRLNYNRNERGLWGASAYQQTRQEIGLPKDPAPFRGFAAAMDGAVTRAGELGLTDDEHAELRQRGKETYYQQKLHDYQWEDGLDERTAMMKARGDVGLPPEPPAAGGTRAVGYAPPPEPSGPSFGLKTLLLFALAAITGLFGAFYYPMALMITAMLNTSRPAFNYLFGLGSIARILSQYIVCAAAVIGCMIVLKIIEVVLSFLFGTLVPIPILGGIVVSIVVATVFMYQILATSHLIGRLFYHTEPVLGWFERERQPAP